jgi:hypothetical protein
MVRKKSGVGEKMKLLFYRETTNISIILENIKYIDAGNVRGCIIIWMKDEEVHCGNLFKNYHIIESFINYLKKVKI